MLQLTKCQDGTALAQLSKEPRARVCESAQGLELNFADEKVQAKLERMMTPGARKAVHELLGSLEAVQAKAAADLLQKSVRATPGSHTVLLDIDDQGTNTTDFMAAMEGGMLTEPEPVKKD